jgi:hypothetical protein
MALQKWVKVEGLAILEGLIHDEEFNEYVSKCNHFFRGGELDRNEVLHRRIVGLQNVINRYIEMHEA